MKRVWSVLGIVLSIVILSSSAESVQVTTLERRNEYGGRTDEESYAVGDDKYKQGLAKIIEHFDGNDRVFKLESIFNEDHAVLDGVQRSVQYFDNRIYRSAVRTRVEFYYTDSYAFREGLAKAIQYYDEQEKRTKIEYFYTEAHARKKQISRLEVLYDPKGSIVKRTYTDGDGKVLSVEEKK